MRTVIRLDSFFFPSTTECESGISKLNLRANVQPLKFIHRPAYCFSMRKSRADKNYVFIGFVDLHSTRFLFQEFMIAIIHTDAIFNESPSDMSVFAPTGDWMKNSSDTNCRVDVYFFTSISFYLGSTLFFVLMIMKFPR